MFSYTTKAKVQVLLPGNLPSAITDADFTSWITDASKEADTEVGKAYPVQSSGQKFEDDPNTPHVIQEVATWLAASWGFARLKELNRSPNQLSGEEKYRKWALEKLARIRNGDIEVYDSTGEDLDTDEASVLVVSARDQIFTATELAKL